jgi:hypothetical protein
MKLIIKYLFLFLSVLSFILILPVVFCTEKIGIFNPIYPIFLSFFTIIFYALTYIFEDDER